MKLFKIRNSGASRVMYVAFAAMLWLVLLGVARADDDLQIDLTPWRALSPEAIAARIDTSGAPEGSDNYALKDVAAALGEAFAENRSEDDAARVLAILRAYARAVPQWPLISRRTDEFESVSEADFSEWDRGGFWGGEWIYLDLLHAETLNEAWLAIKDSKTLSTLPLEELVGIREALRNNLFAYLVDVNLKFYSNEDDDSIAALPYTNMDPFRLKSMARLGREWEPAWVHIAHYALHEFPRVGFYRDGAWHEGSFSYHRQVQRQLGWLADILRDYSDPAGYEFSSYTTRFGKILPGTPGRFDALDPLEGVSDFYARISQALESLVYPDGSIVAVHDTHAYQDHEVKTPSMQSRCLYGMRHCILHRRVGESHHVAHLHYGGTDGHEQSDALNVSFWANGHELASEGGYKRNGPEEFINSVWAHNTVAVDGKAQDNRWDQQEELAQREQIPGHGWLAYRRAGYGNTNNQGDLTFSDLNSKRVNAISASAPRAYNRDTDLSRYERTLVTIPSDDAAVQYVVDVFRVAGGKRHDWILHGDLGREQSLDVDLAFKPIKRTRGGLRVTQAAQASDSWISVFKGEDADSRLQTRHLNAAKALILKATGPAQRRKADAPYLLDSRRSRSTVYVKIHTFGANDPIKKARLLAAADGAEASVSLQIDLKSGRSDIVVLQAPGVEQRHSITLDDGTVIDSDALVSVVARDAGKGGWSYTLGGELRLARAGESCEQTVSAPATEAMTVTQLTSVFGGDTNTLRVNSADVAARSGFPIHVTLPNGVVESYDVASLDAIDNGMVFGLSDVPGMVFDPGSQVTRQTFYPSRVYDGALFARQQPAVEQSLDACLNLK